MPVKVQNKHQRRTEETRRKLLAAGLRVFARDGFEASRLEDIAAEAGHTRGAFYANFATKEAFSGFAGVSGGQTAAPSLRRDWMLANCRKNA